MADECPGEAEVGPLGLGGLGLGNHFPLGLGIGQDVGVLHQRAAFDAAVGPVRPRGRRVRPTFISRTLAFHLGPRGEDPQGLGLEVGGHDRLDEQARLGEHLGGGGVHRTVQAEHGAERAERVAGHGAAEGRGQASSSSAAPQGLLCLMTTAAGSEKSRTMASALSMSRRLL